MILNESVDEGGGLMAASLHPRALLLVAAVQDNIKLIGRKRCGSRVGATADSHKADAFINSNG